MLCQCSSFTTEQLCDQGGSSQEMRIHLACNGCAADIAFLFLRKRLKNICLCIWQSWHKGKIQVLAQGRFQKGTGKSKLMVLGSVARVTEKWARTATTSYLYHGWRHLPGGCVSCLQPKSLLKDSFIISARHFQTGFLLSNFFDKISKKKKKSTE